MTRVRDRATGEVFTERVFGGGALAFLYGGFAGRCLARVLIGPVPHWIYGRLQRSARSRHKIAKFVSSLGIDASEAELPLDAYASLDDFFTRRLKPGARPVDSTREHLVSPADSRVLAFPAGLTLPVKGAQVSIAELLADAELARRFEGGPALVFRLAPADYHRFHFPEGGAASAARPIPGRLHSVHPIALAAGAPSFLNKRAVTLLETASFGTLALVEVGALAVGTIVQTYAPGPVVRGQEKGYFRFGGSTVIVLAARDRLRIDDDLLASSREGIETLVRMGTRIGRVC